MLDQMNVVPRGAGGIILSIVDVGAHLKRGCDRTPRPIGASRSIAKAVRPLAEKVSNEISMSLVHMLDCRRIGTLVSGCEA